MSAGPRALFPVEVLEAMKAILVTTETDRPSLLASPLATNLVDRPFLCHIVEFLVDRGIRDILVVGPATAQARSLLGAGQRWDASIGYRDAHSISRYQPAPIPSGERFLLASAASLPRFSLGKRLEMPAGAIVYGTGGSYWTGWAVIGPGDAASLPPLSDRPAVLSHLLALPNYDRVVADMEFRCGSPAELWQAHMDVQKSNLAGFFHGGVEVTPGVWMGRKASMASSAEITQPVYIGENSRIGPGARIGPFAVIGKDCLIASGTSVRHAVVAPGTYAGDNLVLDHVFVNKRHLVDVRKCVSIDRVDYPILDGVFDFHWSAIPRWMGDAVVSWVAGVFRPLSRVWSARGRRNWPRHVTADAEPRGNSAARHSLNL